MKRDFPNKNTNPVFYIHLRYQEDDGSISNHGGLTIAYRPHDNEVAFEVAIARCNQSDNFCRKTGRCIALGNLNWDRLWICKAPESDRHADIHKHIVDFVQEKVRVIVNAHGTFH
jgi:hypothetical protein